MRYFVLQIFDYLRRTPGLEGGHKVEKTSPRAAVINIYVIQYNGGGWRAGGVVRNVTFRSRSKKYASVLMGSDGEVDGLVGTLEQTHPEEDSHSTETPWGTQRIKDDTAAIDDCDEVVNSVTLQSENNTEISDEKSNEPLEATGRTIKGRNG
ncbi:hypothetical protein QE152_g36053 [Popillia japonica]|uniref:Uncharacterized protein n=1 Tax=Popillia japonica TaxID=7064 RepID=A0AAW1IEF4_POPJA